MKKVGKIEDEDFEKAIRKAFIKQMHQYLEKHFEGLKTLVFKIVTDLQQFFTPYEIKQIKALIKKTKIFDNQDATYAFFESYLKNADFILISNIYEDFRKEPVSMLVSIMILVSTRNGYKKRKTTSI